MNSLIGRSRPRANRRWRPAPRADRPALPRRPENGFRAVSTVAATWLQASSYAAKATKYRLSEQPGVEESDHGHRVRPLFLARRVLEQERRQRGRKVYSLHAPEVECIGKGKAHQPYEFGVKVSVATTVKRPPVHYFRPEPPGSPRREAMEPLSAGALRACIPRSVGRERLL
jgi:hypothetical protein